VGNEKGAIRGGTGRGTRGTRGDLGRKGGKSTSDERFKHQEAAKLSLGPSTLDRTRTSTSGPVSGRGRSLIKKRPERVKANDREDPPPPVAREIHPSDLVGKAYLEQNAPQQKSNFETRGQVPAPKSGDNRIEQGAARGGAEFPNACSRSRKKSPGPQLSSWRGVWAKFALIVDKKKKEGD